MPYFPCKVAIAAFSAYLACAFSYPWAVTIREMVLIKKIIYRLISGLKKKEEFALGIIITEKQQFGYIVINKNNYRSRLFYKLLSRIL
jgi:hypothetical protein